MKVIAMYLPQFHKVKENEEWWGEGFTDWVSAKRGVPLFEGHYQPRLPDRDYYYDLEKKETLVWQADLMKKYKVDGLCFYHYWFENGKKILQKPAENLLQWKDIDMPFCFSWANETWARSWSNLRNTNVWSNLQEPLKDGTSVLLNQSYGSEKDWAEHFSYLRSFFLDKRYIKIDGKPVFLIYKSGQIGCLSKMLSLWREMALESGFPGLYIIGSFADGATRSYLDAELIHEPVSANGKLLSGLHVNHAKRLSYPAVWNAILNEPGDDKTFFGGFVGYDDTPRRGKEGVVIENGTPAFFGEFLAELFAKNYANGKDITFVNAWNEWGEGMYLEPDQRSGTGYLEQISHAKALFKGRAFYYKNNMIPENDNQGVKHELYLNDLDLWMILREKRVSVNGWFEKREYTKIAVYGYGIMGRHLISELRDTHIKVLFVIDAERDKIHTDLPVYLPDETLPEVDIVVVASYYYYDTVRRLLGETALLCSLGDIIHELHEETMQ